MQYSNLFIGSTGFFFDYGSVSPAAQVPFGALRLGPEKNSTKFDLFLRHESGYNYRDTHIRAFSHTRLVGAGLSDFGNFGLIPISISSSDIDNSIEYESWWSAMNKSSEIASPENPSFAIRAEFPSQPNVSGCN